MVGVGILTYATRFGPWAYSDSVSYIEAGRNLATGRGLTEISASGSVNPFIKQPPLLPLILALFHALQLDLVQAMRWLNVFLFAILLLSMGWLSIRQNRWLYLGMPVLWLTSPILIEDYSGFMSEPLYFTTGAAGLILLIMFIHKRKRMNLFVASALLGLSALTRYAGSVFIASGAVALILFDKGSFRKRISRLAVFLALSAGPLMLWIVAKFPGSSQVGGEFVLLSEWWSWLAPFRLNFAAVMSKWIPLLGWITSRTTMTSTWRIPLVAFGLLSALTLFLLYTGFRSLKKNPKAEKDHETDIQLSVTFAAAAVIHLIFLLVVTLLGPWEVRIDTRQLSPVYVFGFSSAFLASRFQFHKPRQKKIGNALQALVIVAFFLHGAPDTITFARELHETGRGYTGVSWQNSELLQTLNEYEDSVIIFSNDIEGIMFHTGIPAYRLPEMQSGIPAPINEQFGSSSEDPLHELFRTENAKLIMFSSANYRFEALYGENAVERISSLTQGLQLELETSQGSIYSYPVEPTP